MENKTSLIYIDRLGLYFTNIEDLKFYVEKHFELFTKEELKDIIMLLVEK